MRIFRDLPLGLTAALGAVLAAGCADRDVAGPHASEVALTTQARAQLAAARGIAPDLLATVSEAPRALEHAFALPPENGGNLEASVPRLADGATRLRDPRSELAVDIRLLGASSTRGAVVDGLVVYPGGGPSGGDVLTVMRPGRVEDFVTFETRPADERLRYALDLLGDGSLRLVGGVLEVVDAAGAPRLRVEAPYAVGSQGRALATLDIEGCAVDRSPRAPWGRALPAPGATTCTVVVDFSRADVGYPRVVDPAWTATTNGLSSARRNLAGGAFALDVDPSDVTPPITLLLASGGFDAANNAVATAELYEPVTRTFAVTGAMAVPRGDHTVTALPGSTGKLLVVGGRPTDSSTQPTSSVELYDPQTGTFQAQPSLQTARHGHTATAYKNGIGQGKVLIAGGTTTLGQPSKTAEVYDVSTASVYNTGSLVFSRTSAAAVWLDPAQVSTAQLTGKVLVTGGLAFGNALFEAELYDIQTDQFQIAVPGASVLMKSTRARANHTATLLGDGRVFLAGGRAANTTDTGQDDGEVFGATGFTGAVVDLLGERWNHTASQLPDGSLIVVGGSDGAGPVATSVVWDTASASATAGAALATARETHIAGEVPQGAGFSSGQGVIVVGGNGPSGPLSSAELLVRPNGDGCALDAECQSGFCVTELVDASDPSLGTVNVCCDTPCDDLCRSCTAAGKGAGSDGACGFAKLATPIGWSCVNEVEFFLECDVGGAISASQLNDCKPNTCDGAAFRCDPSCPCSDTGFCGDGNPPDSVVPADCSSSQPSAGTCQKRGDIGSPCGHCYECADGLTCVDGVCCTTACGSDVTDPAAQVGVQCQACNVAGAAGVCVPSPEGEAPSGGRPACDSDGTICGGACGGSGLSCVYPGTDTKDCQPQTCDCGDGGCAVTRHACDGKGACLPAVTSCEGLVCEGADCKPACAAHADCTTGFLCNFGTGKCDALTGPTCDGDHTLVDPLGATTDCTPYECDASGCKKSCGSVDDCVAPFVCGTDGKCVSRIESPDVSVAGCSAAPCGRTGGGLGALGVALSLALLGARRRASR